MKNVITAVLLLFVVASFVYLVIGERGRDPAKNSGTSTATSSHPTVKEEEGVPDQPSELVPTRAAEQHAVRTVKTAMPDDKATNEPGAPDRKIIVYYFHRTQRCRTCLTMEAYAEEALRDGLPDAFESGALEWRAVNVEEPENEHFVEEYGLTASALVMVLLENGEQEQSKNLKRVWELARDEWGFKDYVRDEALTYLEDGS